MFRTSKKIATSMAELLIILAIIGILSVMYRKTVNTDAVIVRAAYKNIVNELNNFTSTATDGYQVPLGRGSICDRFARAVNTVGDINCDFSEYPLVPNLTTTSGLRFFGLEQRFSQHPDSVAGESSIFIQVDVDGLLGRNRFEEDILPFEILQSGRVRPTGSSNKQQNNVARDAELYAINAAYVPDGVLDESDFQTIANRISYAEAQCLSGNIFPYRDAHFPHEQQFCVANPTLRRALLLDGYTVATRDEYIQRYRRNEALNNTICRGIYNAGGVAVGVTPITDLGFERCNYCYRVSYINDYCATPEQIFINPSNPAAGRRRNSVGEEICPNNIMTGDDRGGSPIADGMCSAPQWAENQ